MAATIKSLVAQYAAGQFNQTLSSTLPDSFTCPWAAISARCLSGPTAGSIAASACVMLQAMGVVASNRTSGGTTSSVAALLQLEASSLSSFDFPTTAFGLDEIRRATVVRNQALRDIFADADVDGNGRLTLDEISAMEPVLYGFIGSGYSLSTLPTGADYVGLTVSNVPTLITALTAAASARGQFLDLPTFISTATPILSPSAGKP